MATEVGAAKPVERGASKTTAPRKGSKDAKEAAPKKGSRTSKDPCAAVDLSGSGSLERLMASAAVVQIRKVHGANIFRRASDLPRRTRRIPTGVFLLDYGLGGGLAVGRINVFWGKKSSAKTTLFLKAIANAQRLCASCWELAPCRCGSYRAPTILFMDVESALDISWAQTLGVDPEHLLVSQPEYAEQTLDLVEAMLRKGCDIVVIDSLAFLAPAKEIVGSTLDDNPAVQARQLGKGVRKFVAALNTVSNARGVAPTLLFTNQVRMQVGVMFGAPEHQPGGLAPGFAASTETKLRPAGYELDKDTGRSLLGKFHFRVEKNKTSYPRIEGEFELALMDTDRYRVGESMDAPSIVDMGEKVGVVTGHAASWRALDRRFGSKTAIVDAMETDRELGARMREAVMHLLLRRAEP